MSMSTQEPFREYRPITKRYTYGRLTSILEEFEDCFDWVEIFSKTVKQRISGSVVSAPKWVRKEIHREYAEMTSYEISFVHAAYKNHAMTIVNWFHSHFEDDIDDITIKKLNLYDTYKETIRIETWRYNIQYKDGTSHHFDYEDFDNCVRGLMVALCFAQGYRRGWRDK